MPQLVVLGLIGAGLYVGYRWISRELARQAEATRQKQEETKRRAAEAQGTPRDLGVLDWDEKAGVYRPKS